MNTNENKSVKRIKKYISLQKEMSYEMNKIKSNFSNESFLLEYRIIICSSIRQSGTTSAIADMFDPNKDMYVTTSYLMTKSFQQYLYDRGKASSCIKPTYKYFILKPDSNYIPKRTVESLQKKVQKLIHKDYVNTSNSSNHIRGISMSMDATVWIDLGTGISIANMPKILDFIKMIDASVCGGHSNIRYIIS